MILDPTIIEKGKEMLAIAQKFGASNIRFFGEVVHENPRANCGVDILVDVERGRVSQEDLDALRLEFSKLLGREVGLNIPDSFIPPILECVLEEVVHLEVVLQQNADHLKGTHVDAIVIDKRMELLVLAKRYGIKNVRLIGEIVRPSHSPDCSIHLLVDLENRRLDQLDLLHLGIRMGKVLGRVVKIFTPDMLLPPLLQDELREAVPL